MCVWSHTFAYNPSVLLKYELFWLLLKTPVVFVCWKNAGAGAAESSMSTCERKSMAYEPCITVIIRICAWCATHTRTHTVNEPRKAFKVGGIGAIKGLFIYRHK